MLHQTKKETTFMKLARRIRSREYGWRFMIWEKVEIWYLVSSNMQWLCRQSFPFRRDCAAECRRLQTVHIVKQSLLLCWVQSAMFVGGVQFEFTIWWKLVVWSLHEHDPSSAAAFQGLWNHLLWETEWGGTSAVWYSDEFGSPNVV